MLQILESELPPSSFVPLLMTIGFIVLLGWATKQTIHRDASISATVGKSWRKLGADVGEEPVIGEQVDDFCLDAIRRSGEFGDAKGYCVGT